MVGDRVLCECAALMRRACRATDLVARVGQRADDAAAVGDLVPVASLTPPGTAELVWTAPGDDGGDADFVSRYFAPHAGIPEDPVTGSAHVVLTPFWAERLGRVRFLVAGSGTAEAELKAQALARTRRGAADDSRTALLPHLVTPVESLQQMTVYQGVVAAYNENVSPLPNAEAIKRVLYTREDVDSVEPAIDEVKATLPRGFPKDVAGPIFAGLREAGRRIAR